MPAVRIEEKDREPAAQHVEDGGGEGELGQKQNPKTADP